jgi:pyruvate/2-oxoacid:ferredoxin oxidoreductase alpha subunit
MIFPFPVKALEEFVASVKQVLVIEISYAAQFTKYLRTFTTFPENTILFKRSGGRNLGISEVDDQIQKALSSDRQKGAA